MKNEASKGIGLFGLIGMVVGSCIGTGAFALSGQLSQVSSPGGMVIAWVIVGLGFCALALSISNLTKRRPDLNGVFEYAEEGFGSLAGFLSGWGYWLSAWLGNIAFATMMMSTLGYFFPAFIDGNSLPCVALASVILWLMTFLIIQGVESAALLNAVVMITKLSALILFLIFGVALFNVDVFTSDFWGTAYNNAVAAGQSYEGAEPLGSLPSQATSCLIAMMWMFVGIEGAAVVSSRARKASDVGKATMIGLGILLVVYVGCSLLPYGFMSFDEVAALDYPALVYVFEEMAPGWGGALISLGIIISTAGAWLSFTILPTETSSEMALRKLLPASWGKMNAKGAPQRSLLVVGACVQVMLIILMFSEDAYDFAYSMCTVSIAVTWATLAAYQVKLSIARKEPAQAAIGVYAIVFLVVGVVFGGWGLLLLTCVGYAPGLALYAKAKRDEGSPVSATEKTAMACIFILAVIGLILLACGVISI